MKLKDLILENTNSQFLTDHKEIVDWLREYNINKFKIRENGVVDVFYDSKSNSTQVKIENANVTDIPIKFGHVDCPMSVKCNKLTNMNWAPESVTTFFNVSGNLNITFKNCPKIIDVGVGTDLFMAECFGNLTNIHKYVDVDDITVTLQPNMLHLILIKKLKRLYIRTNFIDERFKNRNVPEINKIFNKFIPEHDIFGLQDALLEVGCDEEARI